MNRTNPEHYPQKIKEYAYSTIGPVAYEYTLWVLRELRRLGIKTAYFLARDGYLLYRMAHGICQKEFSEIEPRYLFCSRIALRTPTYHLIGNEAFELLTLNGYYVTPRTLLKRPMLNESKQDEILEELGIKDADKQLTKSELASFRAQLLQSKVYKSAVLEVSRKAYAPAIDYLKQMGLFECDSIAIIDSGWSGSMQRSLRQLLESCGYKGKIHGFYFGMYELPSERRDGEYNTFYFNKKQGLLRKVNFSNNLFECMLSAPHPMTVGYEYHNGKARPVFAPKAAPKMEQLIKAQLEGALNYAKEKTIFLTNGDNKESAVAKCYKILRRAMTHPTRAEADIYSFFTFCDDITDCYGIPLNSGEARDKLRSYFFLRRAFNRIFHKESAEEAKLFWVYGVIAYVGKIQAWWYRISVFIWDFLKYLN